MQYYQGPIFQYCLALAKLIQISQHSQFPYLRDIHVTSNSCWQIYFAGVSFGRGSYFATTAQYSLQYSRDYMILAKVATGRYYKGSSAVDRTKLRSGYHSTVNDEANPSIFVVYHDAAAYPEYVLNLSRY